MLDGNDPACDEAAPIPDAVDLVDDWHLRITAEQEIGMQRVRLEVLHVDGPAGRNERLSDHLATEHPLPANLRASAAKQVLLELLKVEYGEQIVYSVRNFNSGLTSLADLL